MLLISIKCWFLHLWANQANFAFNRVKQDFCNSVISILHNIPSNFCIKYSLTLDIFKFLIFHLPRSDFHAILYLSSKTMKQYGNCCNSRSLKMWTHSHKFKWWFCDALCIHNWIFQIPDGDWGVCQLLNFAINHQLLERVTFA